MLTKNIDQLTLRNLVQLRQMPQWLTTDALLVNELTKVHDLMTDARDATSLHQLQGRAQAIRDFRALIAKATTA